MVHSQYVLAQSLIALRKRSRTNGAMASTNSGPFWSKKLALPKLVLLYFVPLVVGQPRFGQPLPITARQHQVYGDKGRDIPATVAVISRLRQAHVEAKPPKPRGGLADGVAHLRLFDMQTKIVSLAFGKGACHRRIDQRL